MHDFKITTLSQRLPGWRKGSGTLTNNPFHIFGLQCPNFLVIREIWRVKSNPVPFFVMPLVSMGVGWSGAPHQITYENM